MRLGALGPVAAFAVLVGCVPAAGAGPSYAVSVFAPVPSPGHPFGVLATSSAVYATTSSGQPFHPSAGDDVVFTYSLSGEKPIAADHVTTTRTMGLYGAAEDAAGRIYVVDMNGRILRYTPSSHGLLGPETYATVPEPYRTIGWPASMWMLLAFDGKGNLYVTDQSLGAIWRIPPNRKPAIWFQSPDLLVAPGGLGGVNGIAIGPDHKLYLAQPGRTDRLVTSTIFRLPMTVASPSLDQLEVFHEFALTPDGHPVPLTGSDSIAFGKSGKLYTTLLGSGEVAVLDRNGREIHRIANKVFDVPLGLSFLGHSLLVANANMLPPEDATHWLILKIDVGETGLPLIRPRVP